MTAPAPAPRPRNPIPPPPLRNGPPTGMDFSLENVSRAPKKYPDRIILHAMEGWGKTSFGAQAPSPIFLMTRGETGLWTLMKAGQLPENIPHFPKPAETWLDVKLALNELIVKEHSFKTLVVDTFNGVERLGHEHVCRSQFNGDWGEKGFMAFQRGYDVSVAECLEMFSLLDRLHEKGMLILLLCHTKVEKFTNPEGPDYDRYQPDVHKKTWSVAHKWADMVLFGMFETHFDSAKKSDKKCKADGGQHRLLKTVRHAAYDAKNRHGLPEEIECGETAQHTWQNFVQAMREATGKDKK